MCLHYLNKGKVLKRKYQCNCSLCMFTCGSSKALMMAAKPNMFPMVLLSSAAIWMILCSRPALSSVVPVQPNTSTANMMAMVWNLQEGGERRDFKVCLISQSYHHIGPISPVRRVTQESYIAFNLLSIKKGKHQEKSISTLATP